MSSLHRVTVEREEQDMRGQYESSLYKGIGEHDILPFRGISEELTNLQRKWLSNL